MSTDILQKLINSASSELGSAACREGQHDWKIIGGRPCPHPKEIGKGVCNQSVYVCQICGDADYGEPGGPGHADCTNHCTYRYKIEM